jgi:hypothetical protein
LASPCPTRWGGKAVATERILGGGSLNSYPVRSPG